MVSQSQSHCPPEGWPLTENNGFNLMEDAFWRLVTAAPGFCRKIHEAAGGHMLRGSAHGFRVFLGVPDGSAAGGVPVEHFSPQPGVLPTPSRQSTVSEQLEPDGPV